MSDLLDRLESLSPAKRALLERARAAASARAGAEPAISAAPDGPAPLSFEQRRLWYLLQLALDTPLYTIHHAFRLRGAVDAAALEAALRGLVARHEPLRTAFRETDGEPVQIVGDGDAFALEMEDLRGDAAPRDAARRYADEYQRRTFDLGGGETFRAALIRTGDDEQHLLLSLHHLAADGVSTGVLLRDLSALYAARLAGRDPHLPPLAVRFRDWAAWQRSTAEETRAADEAYWRAQVDGAPHVLDVAGDHPRPAVQRWDGRKHWFQVDATTTEALRALARREGTTLYAVLAAAFALVLSRHAGEEEILLGTVLANRPRPELEPLAGFFANTLPLRMRVDGDATVRDLLRRAHRAAVGAHEHGRLPFDRIVELAGARRDRVRLPLVQHALVFNEGAAPALALPGAAAEPMTTDSGAAPFDHTLIVEDRADTLAGELLYATALYEPASAARLAGHVRAALAAFAADPGRPLFRVPLATEEERRAIAGWNRTAAPVPSHLCLHRLFERQARETPDHPAVVHESGSLAYADLNRRANRIAHALRSRGVGPETRVAIAMERGPALVAAMLGVMKAGGAWTVLDRASPPARLALVLRAAAPALVIADASSRAALAEDAPEVVEIGTLEGDAWSGDDPAPLARPENLAYVCFTSGSMGGPKGVAVEHRSAVSVLHHWHHVLMRGERGMMLAAAPAHFDFSVGEIWGTLCFGGTVVLVDNALAPLPDGVTVDAAAFVPTAAAERVRQGLPAGVRTIVLGGEVATPALVRDLHGAGVERVINVYGPTEVTVYCTHAEVERGAARVSIGGPIANARAQVLDDAMAPAGVGVAGELWIGGAGVARGYAGRPALTADRFRPDPRGAAGSRIYRTLDRARWLPDGTLEFLGRRDAQVKVRGFRVELEEVEEALAAHPAIAAAAAAPVGEDGARSLAAWLVPAGDDRPSASDLRAFAAERLPRYMIPGAFAWIDALPTGASGKLDRRALPAVGMDDDAAPAVLHVGPRSPVEEAVAALWREVLGVERVGVHDDFFELGGQSILATRLTARIRAELGVPLPVADLLTGPTVEQVARRISGLRSAVPSDVRLPLVPLQAEGGRPPLFLGHPGGGHVVCYRTLAGLLAPAQPVYGLQARGIDDGEAPLGSVEEMASHYLAAIRRLQPSGPYHLAGWSYGGLLAWEMARQLRAVGEEVGLLALLDSGSPVPRDDPEEIVCHARVLQRIVADLVGWAAAGLVRVEKIRHLPEREQALEAIRRARVPKSLPESRVDEVLALTAVRRANLRALLAYRPEPCGAHLTYFRTAGSDRMHPRDPGLDFWSALAADGLTVHHVTGSHGTILHHPHVATVAEHLAAAMAGKTAEAPAGV